MHIISNERALAHWKALMDQPLKFAQRFHQRFLDEQPHMARLMADCIITSPPFNERSPEALAADDDVAEKVGEVTDFAARAAEVIRREAGRPLRTVSQAEVERHFGRVMEEMDRLPKLKAFNGLSDALPLVSRARQQDLLRGLCISYFGGAQRDRLDVFLV